MDAPDTAHVRTVPAVSAHAEHIARIYNHYVLNSTATFDTEPGSVEARRVWLEERSPRHAVYVALHGDEVVGWGALSPYRERPGWRHTAEVAVYLDPAHTGRAIGPLLLGRLVEAARDAQLHVLLSQVVADNHASLAVTERAGFERVALLREVGHKFGEWVDLVLLQKRL